MLERLKSERLFPDYLDGSFNNLQATLKAGLPKVRSKASGHGQGGEVKVVPDYVAAYALHLAATNIVYLCEASAALEKQSS